MRVVILGSGVIGVTSAWYLKQAGHDVVVVDRQLGPALETSFGNAGEISPGYASPWAAPNIPVKAVRWLMMRYAPLIVRAGKLDMEMVRWVLAMLTNCTPGAYKRNKSRMVRVAKYSRDVLDELRCEIPIPYDERMQGTLQLFRKQSEYDAMPKDLGVLSDYGVEYEVLDREACMAAEPGLRFSDVPFVGGLRLPHDETGDCFKFTSRLADLAAERGVEFRYGHAIQRLEMANGAITQVDTDHGPITGDVYLVALGSYSPRLVAPLGIRLPVYPVKGYSITVPIIDAARAPESTVMDESYKVAITRLGNRIRVGGMAELSGYVRDLPTSRRQTLEHSVQTLFPGAADYADPKFWCGLRPMTPDSTPVIGPTKIGNLFLNTGHGTLGWTMACGSGRVIADLISGNTPEIETQDLAISRY